jgi:hypothetical protein
VFDLLRDQLHTVFWMIPVFIQAKVSLDRVDDFLHNVSGSDPFPGRVFDFCFLDGAVGRVFRRREGL